MQYGFSHLNLEHQEIMNLQLSPRIDQLYTTKDSHFRPQIATRLSPFWWCRPSRRCADRKDFQSWWWLDGTHASRTCVSKCLRPKFWPAAARSETCRKWHNNSALAPGVCAYTTFETYVHDNKTEPASIAKTMFPEFRRQFCDDQLLRKTLQELAGKFGTALLDKPKQPAHRADIFRYVYHFQHGGLYLDIKCGFVVPWQRVLEHLAADWSTAAQIAGYNPAPEGQLLGEFMVMAIGVKADHIFQGIIYGKPNHPLLRQATQHAFGRQVFAAKANLEYMIFCLWKC